MREIGEAEWAQAGLLARHLGVQPQHGRDHPDGRRALGLVLSLLFWSSFSPYRRSRTVAGPDMVVEERRIERDLP